MELNKEFIVIFSHGFGVRKDSRWFFDQVSEQLNSIWIQTIQFDYNSYNEDTKELYAISFNEQAKKLQELINSTTHDFPTKKIIIIGHSQWCIIPSLCDLKNTIGIILLAPGFYKSRNEESAKEAFLKISWSILNFGWTSVRVRTDWSKTIIPKDYRKDYFETNSIEKYNNLSALYDVFIIIAKQDKEVASNELNELKNSFISTIDWDHDFTGDNRFVVIDKIKQIIWYLISPKI